MQAHLVAQDDDLWFVITDRPMKIMKANTALAMSDGAPHRVKKPRNEWTTEDKGKEILDNVAKTFYKRLLIRLPSARSKCVILPKKFGRN